MQFQVPQFIEVEDRIFGPLTLKQFIYLAGGAGGSVAIWLFIPFKIIAVIFILPLLAFALALAFYKINGKPFIDVVQAAFYYALGSKLYLWKKENKAPANTPDEIAAAKSTLIVPKISESKLKDLTWSLDVKESLNPVTRDEDK